MTTATKQTTALLSDLLTTTSNNNRELIALVTQLCATSAGRKQILTACNKAMNTHRLSIAKQHNFDSFKDFVEDAQQKLDAKEISKNDFNRLLSIKIGSVKTKSNQYKPCALHQTIVYALNKASDELDKQYCVAVNDSDNAVTNLYSAISLSAKKAKQSGTKATKATKVDGKSDSKDADKTSDKASALLNAIESLDSDALSALTKLMKAKAVDKASNTAQLLDTLAFSHNKTLEKADSLTVESIITGVAKRASKAQKKSAMKIVAH